MDEVKLLSKDVNCIVLPKDGKFCIGNIYHLVYNRTNDIVWYTCKDNDGNTISFYENNWTKYFKQL